ncbi:hypothetical protein DSM106972_094170 [Dulcicalothrix desertica PCC 7102]|uniref:ParB/Sulfiredoxin domain-containing protein n=1 Tax=Dulcicalothrix desertica PCC 7102 TaxID=232991 RepID=A0A3S1A5S6_9CYAN|nr:hypothetical protein [Dulcicalothrix desertica]RUS94158.1 hypothetical protein DSM106972_094170 [Dulcicalothrix desertica PCC 7102]TWH43822.1 hypothetical protein CAL7102_07566 [Dulcicalothrix desertica PCC 7102]
MSVTSIPCSVFWSVDPALLKPHPLYMSIYGEEVDVSNVINWIRNSQFPRPLLINQHNIIINGYPYWKAALCLGWNSISVEIRRFPNPSAELEALLLENADRNKTNEQKVREAIAWEQIEKEKAKKRQQLAACSTNQKLGRNVDKTHVENFPSSSRGLTRNKVAKLVGLGSGRNYAKAKQIVTKIDDLIQSGKTESALDLRSCLNKKSIDAAAKILKALPPDNNVKKLDDQEISCWNCKFCTGEKREDKHIYYCNKFGSLNFLKQPPTSRAVDCPEWSHRLAIEEHVNSMPNPSYFTLTLPSHLQPLFEDAARAESMPLPDWVCHHLLKIVQSSMGSRQ